MSAPYRDVMLLEVNSMRAGLEIKFFSREPNCIFKSYLKVLHIETSTSLGYLQKFEGALGSWHL